MKHPIYSKFGVGICAALLISATSGCMDNDVYNPNGGKHQLPPIDQFFGFETRGDVKLSIDYNAPGYQANFQIFDENPIAKPGTLELKEGVKAIYSAYTTKEGKFEGTVNIPTSVKEAWLYTNRLGISGCAKMEVANGILTYDAKKTGAKTRASGNDLTNWFNKLKMPYDITYMVENDMYRPSRYEGYLLTGSSTMYSVCKWGTDGKITGLGNEGVTIETKLTTAKGEFNIAGITERTNDYLKSISPGDKRRELIKSAKDLNIVTTESTQLSVTFLDEAAEFRNGFGYYYYPTSSALHKYPDPGYIYDDLKEIKKYIVFPNASKVKHDGSLDLNTTVRLKYFDKDGNASYDFPTGYAVGWFLLSNGFNNTGTYENTIKDGRVCGENQRNWGIVQTSNDMVIGSIDFRRFISMFDKTSGSVVIGVEDREDDPDDYRDLTFLVSSNKKLDNSEKPTIPPAPEKPVVETQLESGILAFEDTWPMGGDYDMNDVTVKYNRTVTYGKSNNAVTLVEEFTFIQDKDAALNTNYFAYQIPDASYLGTYKLGEGVTFEKETNSFRITDSSLNGIGKTYRIERTFTGQVDKDKLLKEFNPFIIIVPINTEAPIEKGRTEVHLPKTKVTVWANEGQVSTEDDAYFIDLNGTYPFAINIANDNFTLSKEKVKINITYPKFDNWVKSSGTEDTDWYKKK